jgi:Tfp pilus assembly protein PilO
MSETKKTLIIAASLLLIIGLGWYLVFYQPRLSKVTTLKNETDNLLTKIRSFRVTDQQIAGLEKGIEKLEKELSEVQEKVFLKPELPKVVRMFEAKGKSFGLKFDTAIPDYASLIRIPQQEEEASDLLKLTVHFRLQGYYRSFGNFIDTLDEFPFTISLGEIGLYYNERIYPELEINLDVVFYLRVTSKTNIKT